MIRDMTTKGLFRRLQLANQAIKEAQEIAIEVFKDDLIFEVAILDMARTQLAMAFDGIKTQARLKAILSHVADDDITDKTKQMSAYIESRIDEIDEILEKADKPDPKDVN